MMSRLTSRPSPVFFHHVHDCAPNASANPTGRRPQRRDVLIRQSARRAPPQGLCLPPLLLQRSRIPQSSSAPVRVPHGRTTRIHTTSSTSLVAAYDMGAPPALLKLIYEDLAPTLRPINRQGEDITEANWTTRLGERK